MTTRILTITSIAGLMIASACSPPPPADAPSGAPPQAVRALTLAPAPEAINAGNADAAADALEKEIAADTE